MNIRCLIFLLVVSFSCEAQYAGITAQTVELSVNYDKFGVIGDSNADGRGGSIPSVATNTLYNWTGSSFVEVTTQSVANTGINGSIYQQFATDYKAATGKAVYLINGAKGGSSVYDSGDDDNWYTTGNLYDLWKAEVDESENVRGGGLKGIFLNVGINDVRAGTTTANIDAGFQSLISRLTTDFPGVPILVINIGRTETEVLSHALVDARQVVSDLVEDNTNVHFIASAGTFIATSGYNVDNLHYSQTTNNAIGSMAARWTQNESYTKVARSIISSHFDDLSSGRKTLIQNWVTALGDDYYSLNHFINFRTTTANNVFLDWTFLGFCTTTAVTFNANDNVSTNGTTAQFITTSYINSFIDKSSHGQNNFMFGVRLGTRSTADGTACALFGAFDGTAGIRVTQGSGASLVGYRANAAATAGTEQDLLNGTLYTVKRNGTSQYLFRNKTQDHTSTLSSAGACSLGIRIGLSNENASLQLPQNATYLYGFGAAYTGFDYDAFYDATEALISGW